MNATTFLNAVNSALKPAAIGFLTILGFSITTALATAISTLIALLIPALVITTKAAIFGYPLFLAGLIAIKIKEQCKKKETRKVIAMLPPCKPCEKHFKQIETIQNEVLITPPSTEAIFDYQLRPKQPTWQQQILKEIWLHGELPTANQPTTEIQDTSQPTEALAIPGMDTALRRDAKPLNNQLAISTTCWQAISATAKLLDGIKASELKSIASELQIPKSRNMNKTQLLIEIVTAHESDPAFFQ
ncbi:MAG TPA: hypothetical protein VIQ31_23050 [Phormidium sp.]